VRLALDEARRCLAPHKRVESRPALTAAVRQARAHAAAQLLQQAGTGADRLDQTLDTLGRYLALLLQRQLLALARQLAVALARAAVRRQCGCASHAAHPLAVANALGTALVGGRKHRAEHNAARTKRHALDNVARAAYAAIGNDGALELALVDGAPDLGQRRELRHAVARHLARGADGT